MDPSVWRRATEPPRLEERQVDVWRARLDLAGGILERLAGTLGEEERARASRFATAELRRRYVAARGVLRTLLASYLDRDPRRIEFRHGAHGKPYLAGDDHGSGLEFNLSHAGNLALFGFARGREIGVDLEWTGRMVASADLASRFFSEWEVARLSELAPAERDRYFFALWTSKEAFVKALGAGVSFGLDRFDVRLEPGDRTGEVLCKRGPEIIEPWYVLRLEPGPGFVAALAMGRPDLEVRTWDWTA